MAAANSAVMAGVRAGVAEYRLTAEHNYWQLTPLAGPFLGFRIPIAGRFRGVLGVSMPRVVMPYRRLLAQGASWDDALAHAASVG